MTPTDASDSSPFLDRLRQESPLIAAELRPPPTGLDPAESRDRWIDLHHTVRRLTRERATVFLTDGAVGEEEEQNLRHLTTNLVGDLDPTLAAPFLTCKHPLSSCLMYADRAAASGIQALVVVGGDTSVGPPRCVDHAYQLRQRIRRRVPSLTLGGWANPHADPAEQVDYLLEEEFTAEFYLTQVVTHHHLERVEAFLEEARRREVPWPAVFGVFYYRSANPETLEQLGRFFPVPAEEITREFEGGDRPEEICARTIRRLRDVGVERFYLSNLGYRRASERRERVLDLLD